MRCEVCEASLRPGALYCPNCGMPVSYNTPPSSAKLPAIENVPADPSWQPAEQPQSAQSAQSALSPQLSQPPTLYYPPFQPAQPSYHAVQPTYGVAAHLPAPERMPVPTHVLPPQRRPSRRKGALVALLCLLLVLVGGGLGYYFLVLQPAATTTSPSIPSTPSAATVQAEATSIATAPDTLYSQVTSASPAIQDSLNSNNASTWEAYSGTNGRCAFTGGLYHINSQQAGLTACFFRARSFEDFTLQVQMTITRGDAGGIAFRFPSSSGAGTSSLNAYIFIVNVLGQSSLIRVHNSDYTPLITKSSSNIGKGVNQATLMTVIARGSVFFLYVNKQFITTVRDATFQYGLVGLLSLSFQDPTEVAFHNAQIWT